MRHSTRRWKLTETCRWMASDRGTTQKMAENKGKRK